MAPQDILVLNRKGLQAIHDEGTAGMASSWMAFSPFLVRTSMYCGAMTACNLHGMGMNAVRHTFWVSWYAFQLLSMWTSSWLLHMLFAHLTLQCCNNSQQS